jgi:hypothetical protein
MCVTKWINENEINVRYGTIAIWYFKLTLLANKSNAVPVGFLLAIPVRVIEIPVNKKAVIYL